MHLTNTKGQETGREENVLIPAAAVGDLPHCPHHLGILDDLVDEPAGFLKPRGFRSCWVRGLRLSGWVEPARATSRYSGTEEAQPLSSQVRTSRHRWGRRSSCKKVNVELI